MQINDCSHFSPLFPVIVHHEPILRRAILVFIGKVIVDVKFAIRFGRMMVYTEPENPNRGQFESERESVRPVGTVYGKIPSSSPSL